MQLYEYPGNELMRIALKFEHLYNKAKYFSQGIHIYDSQSTILILTDLLNLIDRVDLRNMLTREISKHLNSLRRLQSTPQIDHNKLQMVIQQLESVIDTLHKGKGVLTRELFDNYFLQSIRRLNGQPGNDCPYHMPEIQSWLQQNAHYRQQQCHLWISYLYELSNIIEFLLQLARESMIIRKCEAHNGIYQMSLPNPGACQLIRIWLPIQLSVFPRFNLSQCKVNIRFFNGSTNSKYEQISDSFEFDLATCTC